MIEDRLVDAAASMTREQLDDLAAKWEAFTAAKQIAEAEYRKGVGYGTCNRGISDAYMNALLANPGALIALARAALERLINGADALAIATDPASGAEGKDGSNPTESVAVVSCQTQGSASTAGQLDTARGHRDPASGEGTDKEASVHTGEKSTDAQLAILRHSVGGEGAEANRLAKQMRGMNEPDSRVIGAALATRNAEIATLRAALERMISEFEKMTRYGSPMAKAANENLQFARKVLAAINQPKTPAP